MNDPIAIALERRPDVVFRLGAQPALRVGGLRRLGSQDLAFAGLELVADQRHSAWRKLRPLASGGTPKFVRECLAEIGKRRACTQIHARRSRAGPTTSSGTCSRE